MNNIIKAPIKKIRRKGPDGSYHIKWMANELALNKKDKKDKEIMSLKFEICRLRDAMYAYAREIQRLNRIIFPGKDSGFSISGEDLTYFRDQTKKMRGEDSGESSSDIILDDVHKPCDNQSSNSREQNNVQINDKTTQEDAKE